MFADPRFSDPRMAERFASQIAGHGERACGEQLHDAEETCLRPPHGEDVAHVTLVDGSPVQWTNVSADQGQSNAERAEHGGA